MHSEIKKKRKKDKNLVVHYIVLIQYSNAGNTIKSRMMLNINIKIKIFKSIIAYLSLTHIYFSRIKMPQDERKKKGLISPPHASKIVHRPKQSYMCGYCHKTFSEKSSCDNHRRSCKMESKWQTDKGFLRIPFDRQELGS